MTWALPHYALLSSAVFVLFVCPAWQLSKTWSGYHLCKTFIIRVMDDVICMPTSYVVHDWLFWDRECMHMRGLGLLVWGLYTLGQ